MKVPRTLSKNPVTILRTVIKAIEGEPKRYRQTTWCKRASDKSAFKPPKGWPDCGTIGCVALWTCVVTGEGASDIMFSARRILGLDIFEAEKLFSCSALGEYTKSIPGTKSYAQAGVDHIKRFVKKKWGVTL